MTGAWETSCGDGGTLTPAGLEPTPPPKGYLDQALEAVTMLRSRRGGMPGQRERWAELLLEAAEGIVEEA